MICMLFLIILEDWVEVITQPLLKTVMTIHGIIMMTALFNQSKMNSSIKN